jgi:hypothetical protein
MPTIVTGIRGADDAAPASEVINAESDIILKSSPKLGKDGRKPRRFITLFPKLRISVKHLYDRIALDGTRIAGENKVVQFKKTGANIGEFITSDGEEIEAIEASPEYGVSTYDFDEWLENSKAARRESIIEEAMLDEKLAGELISRLKVDPQKRDFIEAAEAILEPGVSEPEEEEAPPKPKPFPSAKKRGRPPKEK